MNFEQWFTKTVASGNITGLQAAPTAAPGVSIPGTSQLVSYRAFNNSGVPLKALLIGYSASDSANANALTANVYLWDGCTQSWLLWSANVSLKPQTLTSVTMPCPSTQMGLGVALEAYVSVANAATGNGIYTITLAPGG